MVICGLLTTNLFAETYFVKADGNDQLDGKSDATAWGTIGKVNSYKFDPGDDVYFKCGGTYRATRLSVRWSGTEENPTIIGAYYGDEIIGVQGDKPIFDGENKAPTYFSNGLINVAAKSYVTITNVKIYNSAGHGLRFSDGSHYGFAINVETVNSDNAGIQWWQSEFGKAINCEVSFAAMKYYRGEIGDWPGCLSANFSPNFQAKGCKVFNVHGEGIGIYKHSHNSIVENCLVYNAKKVGIYVSASHDNIVRFNMIYGTTDTTYHRYGNPPQVGPAMKQGDEGWVDYAAYNNKFYGNWVANCSCGFGGGSPTYGLTNVEIYNNTFINCDATFWLENVSIYSNSAIRNNISWPRAGATYGHIRGDANNPGLVWSNNNWSSTVDGDRAGVGDVIGLPDLYKSSGWDTIKEGELKLSAFSLNSNSSLKNAGAALPEQYDSFPDINKNSDYPFSLKMYKQSNYGEGWEIGADIDTDDVYQSPPAPPANLKLDQ